MFASRSNLPHRTSTITGLAILSLASGVIGIIIGGVASGNVLIQRLPLDVAARSFLIAFPPFVIGIVQVIFAAGLLRMDGAAWAGTVIVSIIALAYVPIAIAVNINLLFRNTLGNPASNVIFAAILVWQFLFALAGSILILEAITRMPQRVAFGRFRPSDFTPEM